MMICILYIIIVYSTELQEIILYIPILYTVNSSIPIIVYTMEKKGKTSPDSHISGSQAKEYDLDAVKVRKILRAGGPLTQKCSKSMFHDVTWVFNCQKKLDCYADCSMSFHEFPGCSMICPCFYQDLGLSHSYCPLSVLSTNKTPFIGCIIPLNPIYSTYNPSYNRPETSNKYL